jgi:hypothetical protein
VKVSSSPRVCRQTGPMTAMLFYFRGFKYKHKKNHLGKEGIHRKAEIIHIHTI